MRILFLFFVLLISVVAVGQGKRFSFSKYKMGSPFQISLYAADSVTANRLANKSYALVDSLNTIFSDYMDSSELNLLCATAGTDSFITVSPALYDILLMAKEAWQKSEGCFDITVGPLSRLWRKERRAKHFPDADVVAAERKKIGFEKIIIDTIQHRVKLMQAGMQLDLGGIAAGYMAQKIIDFLNLNEIKSALVNASGDIVCSGPPPGKNGWIIGVNMPGEKNELMDKNIELRNASISTSGDVFQFAEHNGRRYSHIINPITGYGVTFQRNVTIIAPDGATADWLATACSILPISKAKKLVRHYRAELLITQMTSKGLKMHTTRAWKSYLEK